MQVLADRYRLVELIGSGGMAVVWRAFDEVLGRQVAVKVLTSDTADDPSVRRRIRDEARAAARLAHPHISVVHDYGEWVDANDAVMPFVVMELIEGPSLHEVLAEGPLPWRRAASIAAQVGAGLAAAHARGLVHRDVKPGNVVLAPTGAKLVDFGISAVVGDAQEEGDLLGTPAYIAPERLIGGPTSPAADVYALGLLLYRSVAGQMPWQPESPTAVLLAHLHTDPEPLPPVDGDRVPEALAELCERCLAKDPAERPSAAEVVLALTALPGMYAAEALAPNGDEHGAAHGVTAPVQTTFLASHAVAPHPWTRSLTRVFSKDGDDPQRHRVRRWLTASIVSTAAAVAVPLVLTAIAASGGDPSGGPAAAGTVGAAAPGPTGVAQAAQQPACQAIYRVRTDDGERFTGELTIVNSGTDPLRNWTVSFRYPDQQRATGVGWRQQGDAVTIGPVGRDLAAGKRATSAFRGTYRDANPMPMSFTVDQVACETTLVGPVGSPPGETAGAPASEPDKSGPGGGGGDSSGPGPGPGKDKKKGKQD